jgi:NAD(P)-dependent dehydrogenase (short-subunit alcohol dehydrogenase family)
MIRAISNVDWRKEYIKEVIMISPGRVAIVTGGGSGLGRAISLILAANRARVLIADINQDAAQAVSAEIEKAGGEAIPLHVNVSQEEECERMVKKAVDTWNSVDILVNSAGIIIDNPLRKVCTADFDKVMAVNLKGTLFSMKKAEIIMSERKYGRIVNITSVAYKGNAGQAAYASSKGAVGSLTKVVALELARRNITVNAIAPGIIETPMARGITAEQFERIAKATPVGHIGQPADIAHAAMFLVADEAGYITGQVIDVDGGLTVGIGTNPLMYRN